MGLFDKLKSGLFKTRKSLVDNAEELARGRDVDDALLDEFEELLTIGYIDKE